MFLKSITIKGFKSFADKTILDVEPGITVIVGPNGSGKSNVVDALAWVLGTASPKLMRSGTMADVIFAGSPTRKALGKAMVEIVIDNSEGQLGDAALGSGGSAQQFREVRVAREIYASGENRYLINGEEVRALDVQELLSDTGLGRELHTIVGQGQLDAILQSKPEGRRAFIEEAAGILKHRRRRERALRKLEQVDVHTDKLKTVLRELRRQLRPLERQAEAANTYAQLQSQLRDVQVKVGAHDLANLTRLWEHGEEAETESRTRQEVAESAVAEQRTREAAVEAELARLKPTVETAQSSFYELSSLLERSKGTAELITAKRRHLVEYVEEPLAGRPPAELRGQADQVDEERTERVGQRDAARSVFDMALAVRREAETHRRAHEQHVAAEQRRRAQQRERVLRWEGEVSALRGSVAAAESEIGRVAAQLQGLDDRSSEAEHDVAKVESEIQRLDRDEVELTNALEDGEAGVTTAQSAVDRLVARERDLDRERSSLAARAEALRAALAETSGGAATLLAAGLDGVVGLLADHVRVQDGADAVVTTALGPLGEAILTTSPEQARRAVAWLRDSQAGRALILAGRTGITPPPLDEAARADLSAAGARPVAELFTSKGGDTSDRAVAALHQALGATYLVGDWDQAVLLQGRHPWLTFVTTEGDLAGPFGFAGGASTERSSVLTATGADEAEQRVTQLLAELASLQDQLVTARAALADTQATLRTATARINESDAQITGAAERLARLNKELHALVNQREVVASQHHELTQLILRDRESLAALMSRGPDVEAEEEPVGPDLEAERLEQALEAAREAEVEARVSLERLEEQLRHLEGSAAALRREADQVELALAEAARRREARRRGIDRCADLAVFAQRTVDALEASIRDAQAERDRLDAVRRTQEQELGEIRSRLREVTAQLEEVKEERHAADLRRSDLKHQLDQLVARMLKDHGLSATDVALEHPTAAEYDRETLASDEEVLVRKLGLLGRVNPLALEEFKALEERHRFLSTQLEDLNKSKRDLNEVVEAVDQKIKDVFQAAFEDVAREFERTFAIVFPGGHGKLVLTDPSDMLATGVEIEARPPGKKIRRLSLLSGGERSLTALSLMFAIFTARPSPFYVLDEVEAALDDVNLQRLLTVIAGFKETSQLIIVTHQKRTMEYADVLYGITMGSDAVTKVIAERMNDGADLDPDLFTEATVSA